jgi:hypothetical protein
MSYNSGLTDAQLRATALPVSGTVGVSGTVTTTISGSVAVTGTFWQATQPVSGTVGVSGSVAVTGPLTDAQIRATALPVSGTVTANAGTGTFAVSGPLTDTQLRASVLPVSLTSTTITGTVAATQSGAWNVTNISGTVSLPTGAATETTLAALNAKVTAVNTGAVTISAALPAGTNNIGDVDVLTLPVAFNSGVTSATTQRVTLATDVALPTGANVIGGVTQSGTWNIGTVTTLPALPANQSVNNAQIAGVATATGNGVVGTGVQRVAIASDNTAFSVNALQSGTWNIGSITTLPALSAGAAVIGAVTQSSTWTVQPGNTANTTPWLFRPSDGTNNVAVKAASTAAVAADPALVVAVSPNNTLPANITQLNGVARLAGNGVTGTGSPRVTIASDNTPFTVNTTPTTPTASIINSAATTNATSIKASAGTLYSIAVSNVGAAAAFVKLYNLTTAPTVGTSTIALTIPVAASGVVTIPFGSQGMRFGTGIALAITNLVADTDTTAIAAGQVKVLTSYI